VLLRFGAPGNPTTLEGRDWKEMNNFQSPPFAVTTNIGYNTDMNSTLEITRIRKRTRTIELNPKEIAILQDMIFRRKVETRLELNGYTKRDEYGSDFQIEADFYYKALGFLQTKLDNLTK